MALQINDWLLIACVIFAIATVAVLTFASTKTLQKHQAQNNPYYYCDGDWECCTTQGCDADKVLGLSKAGDTYNPQDKYLEGSAFHQNCILPIQNGILNFEAGTTGAGQNNLNSTNLYPSTVGVPTTPTTYGLIPWGIGCTGPGGTGRCADPTYNPQVYPVCPYVSFDAPPSGTSGNGHTGGTHTLPAGYQAPTESNTVNPANWNQNTNFGSSPSNYISGYTSVSNPTGNGYTCPFNLSGGGGNNSKLTACGTQRNAFYSHTARPDGPNKIDMPASQAPGGKYTC